MNVVQIVPRLAPGYDAIGDYSLILAHRLRNLYGIETNFLACSSQSQDRDLEEIDGFKVSHLMHQVASHFCQTLRDITAGSSISGAILQFAPYGYSKRGCPAWLVKGLRDSRRIGNSIVITMFHELNAGGTPPWKSSFWLNSIQKNVVRGVAKFSDRHMTNNQAYYDSLNTWGIERVIVSPTFSNMGEPPIRVPMSGRKSQVVVFGRPWQRQKIYTDGSRHLKVVCQAMGVKAIVDIGAPIPNIENMKIQNVRVESRGMLPASEVSVVLSESLATVTDYPIGLLGKSGAYAASCSHGTIPFVINDGAEISDYADDLLECADFVSVSNSGIHCLLGDIENVSSSVYTRYQNRSSVKAAGLYAGLLQ